MSLRSLFEAFWSGLDAFGTLVGLLQARPTDVSLVQTELGRLATAKANVRFLSPLPEDARLHRDCLNLLERMHELITTRPGTQADVQAAIVDIHEDAQILLVQINRELARLGSE